MYPVFLDHAFSKLIAYQYKKLDYLGTMWLSIIDMT